MTSTVDHAASCAADYSAQHANQGGIQHALAALPQPLREVLVLRECRGWGYEQIAESLNVSRSVVHQRITDARREMLRLI
jgi:RNA polymerase sigma factor (sigma-70 family)